MRSNDNKKYIQILENLCVEPEDGQEARLDADELDAVLYAIKTIKRYSGDNYNKSCVKCKYRDESIGKPRTEGTFWCDKKHYLTGSFSCCDDFEKE